MLCATHKLCFTAIKNPLRDYQYLEYPKEEFTIHLQKASVVIADYDLIKADFPELNHYTNSQIDAWLINNAAFMSKNQILDGTFQKTNTEIPIDALTKKIAYRPNFYGRALVIPVQHPEENKTIGLIDAKGVGANYPRRGSHRSGVHELDLAIEEYITEKLIDKIFHHHHTKMNTIGSYAVLYPHFDVSLQEKDEQEYTKPAGILLRQAHRRIGGGFNSYHDMHVIKSIESLLRHYGVTSAGENFFIPQNDNMRLANIQRSIDGDIVDFGTYIILEKFEDILGWTDRGREIPSNGYLEIELLHPSQPDTFIQPIDSIRIPVDTWGIEKNGTLYIDNMGQWSTYWANLIAKNQSQSQKLQRSIQNKFKKITDKWSSSSYHIPENITHVLQE